MTQANSGPSTGSLAGVSSSTPMSYADAGVDMEAGDSLVERIKPMAKRTMREGVLAGIGGFGAMFEIPKRYKEPVLVSGTDGVGTKLKLAFALNRHDTIGIDLVAMSVNDILVQGAEPLFFLDYFACGKLDVETGAAVIGGVAKGCELSGCALIGGETAEMPGMYPEGEYDLAGFAVGAVEKSRIISGASIEVGDAILGLASSGPHSNGYSLIRRLVERQLGEVSTKVLDQPYDPRDPRNLSDALMAPTRIYVKPLLAFMDQMQVKGMAHITGGGLTENIPRILGDTLQAKLQRSSWEMPPVFEWLQKAGNVAQEEMWRVFNCGIGMVMVVSASEKQAALAALRNLGEQAWEIGAIVERPPGQASTVIV